MIFPEGGLVKMSIKAFKDIGFSDEVPDGEIKALINPENFKETYAVAYKDDQPTGTSAKEQKFDHIKPQEFTVKLLLDSTGIFETLEPSVDAFKAQLASLLPSEFKDASADADIGISEEVENLKNLLFVLNGETHEPNFIKINWAALEIKCKLKKLDIDYKMFNSQGYPIRAEVSLTCINTISDVLRKAQANKSSPDLTHCRTVLEGDTLPLMAHRIYGSPKYYLEVARANKILNFRNLEPGQEIFFPPIKKGTA